MSVLTGPPQTRSSILDAAEATFGRDGFRGATMAAVAEEAGVSRPLVHRYFGDKETLYRQVVERLLREWNEALQNAASRGAPTTGHRLRAVITECLGWARRRQLLRGVLLRDADATRLVARATLVEGRDRLPDLLEQILRGGVQRGDIRGDLPADETAAVLAQVVVAAAVEAIRTESEADHLRHLETVVEVVLHGVVVAR